jgi:hypothetical protein
MTERQTLAAALLLEGGRFGSFAEFIGRAYIAASPTNRERLAGAFPELFQAANLAEWPSLRSVSNE